MSTALPAGREPEFAPLSEQELRETERWAREQLAFHGGEPNVRCIRCQDLAEILRLIATVRAREVAVVVSPPQEQP